MQHENHYDIFSDIEKSLDHYYVPRASLFKKLMGTKVIDVLLHFPSYVIERVYSYPISEKDVDKIVTTKVQLNCIEISPRNSRRPSRIFCMSGTIPLELTIFGGKGLYIKKAYPVGSELIISGKLTKDYTGSFQMTNPDRISPVKNLKSFVGFFNIYPLTAGLAQDAVYSVVRNSIRILENSAPQDWLNENLLKEHGWPSFVEAIKSIHNPTAIFESQFDDKARQRICFDELLAEQIAIRLSRTKSSKGIIIKNDKTLMNKLLNLLPFELTESQKKALKEIFADMESGKIMTRLLQGDVGSGKTIVAVLVALNAIESGYQCAFLAPTEILARQHYNTISSYLEKLGIQVELLTSNETGKLRTQILQNVSSGIAKILVGTHAIITDQVSFNNLGFVVIDEQHRFGVNQRLKLIEKGVAPHILSMTATPIPRTMILGLYGDIAVSSIMEKPTGRKDITTRALPMSRIEDVVKSLENILKNGEKVYWVCPLIEESDKTDYTCVINRTESLRGYFNDKVQMLHGKMAPFEKQEIFRKFKSGEANILVATTVIEVGVDVPDATVIIIENAEKFGLAQLHQLRGRVGRSHLQSYCILLHESKISQIAVERIKVIRESHDGFNIAEKDLLLRGGGEMFGTKQSGAKKYKSFDFADPKIQTTLYPFLKLASELATEIVQNHEVKKYEILLKIFAPENFANVKNSF